VGPVAELEGEATNTKTLRQTVTFRASPVQVYDMLMDSKKHQSLSREPARISRRVGGTFKAWGSHISGINLVLKRGRKIVQAWRATGWWPDHYSIAIFDIEKVRGVQTAIHADRHSSASLRRSLPWMDRGVLDADEGNVCAGDDRREEA
jgi:uncharacterized protein YndB with AHSA1/START domain